MNINPQRQDKRLSLFVPQEKKTYCTGAEKIPGTILNLVLDNV